MKSLLVSFFLLFIFAVNSAVFAESTTSLSALKKEKKKLFIGMILESKQSCGSDRTCFRQEIKKHILSDISLFRNARKKCNNEEICALEVFLQSKSHPFGKEDAPVLLIEFVDYQCPYCKRAHDDIFPQIKKEYIDTGKVHYEVVQFPLDLHQFADISARASLCAEDLGEQEQFEMNHFLFENQEKLGSLVFEDIAEKKWDTSKEDFQVCLKSEDTSQKIQDDKNFALEKGITGTPSFLIPATDEIIVGAVPFENFQEALDRALEAKGASDLITKDGKTPLRAQESMQTALPEKGEMIARMQTNKGLIVFRFFPKETPKTVENFLTHAKNGYYDGLTFHRVIDDFMIQGGDPVGNGTGGESIWGKNFKDEFTPTLHNIRGSLSMANRGPNTNGSQFFINQADNIFLDGKHTVFGQVIEGMDIVDAIAGMENNQLDAPVHPIIIEKIEVVQY